MLALALSEGYVAKAYFPLKNSHLLLKDGLSLMLSTYSNPHLLKGLAKQFFMGPGYFLANCFGVSFKFLDYLEVHGGFVFQEFQRAFVAV